MSSDAIKPPEPFSPPSGVKTFIFKVAGPTEIEVDVYVKDWQAASASVPPVFVFLHGGAWIGGNRREHSRALVEELLERGFLIASFDYRLVPESLFVQDQLSDVKDIEQWVRDDMPQLLGCPQGATVNSVVVAGASAGALLALLVPSLWKTNPTAILSIYGPTDMHHLPYVAKGPFANLELQHPDWHSIQSWANFTSPPAFTPPPTSPGGWLNNRTKFGMYMFRSECTTEVLLHGLGTVNDSTGERVFPEKGQATAAEIDSISPIQLCRKYRYPPVLQVMGSEDSVFDLSHVTKFATALEDQHVEHEEIIVDGADHAFDMFIQKGDVRYQQVTVPAVDWVERQCRSN